MITSLYLVFEEGKENGSVGDETETDDAPIESDQHILGSLGQSEEVVFVFLFVFVFDRVRSARFGQSRAV